MKIFKTVIIYCLVLALAFSFNGCSKAVESSSDKTSEEKSEIKSDEATSEEEKDLTGMATTFAKEKEETVNAKADAAGSVDSITVSETLSGVEGDKLIKDSSELLDIMNTDGDEEFYKQEDDVIVWENHGDDISYEGKLDSTELPVGVKISYKLDGKEIKAGELAGKSGEVEIRFDYINKTKETVKVKGKEHETVVPFVAISMIPLDSKKFKHVELENGKIMKMSGSTIAVSYCLPKLSESLKLEDWELTKDIKLKDYSLIKADVKDFSLDYTATIFSNGIFKGIEDDTLDSGDDMKESMDDLGEASDELVDGTSDLYDGAGTFSGYLSQFVNGANQLSSGAKELSSGAKLLDDNGDDLAKGAKGLRDGLKQLNTSLSKLDLGDGLDSSKASSNDMTTAMSGLSSALTTLGTDAGELQKGLKALSIQVAKETGKLPAFDASSVTDSLTDMQKQATIISKYSSGMSEEMKGLASLPDQLDSLKKGVATLYSGSKELYSGVKVYTNGVSQLSTGSEEIAKGSATLGSSGNQLKTGFGSMLTGMFTLKNGFKVFNDEGIDQLTSVAGEDMANTIIELRALREADKKYKSFTKCLDEQDASVKFIIETEEIKAE